jgi:hypothetical protein
MNRVRICYIRVSTSYVRLRLQRTGIRIQKCILAFLATESMDKIFSRSIKHGVNTHNMLDLLHPSPSKGKISSPYFPKINFRPVQSSTSLSHLVIFGQVLFSDFNGMLRSHWTLPNIDTEVVSDLLTSCSCKTLYKLLYLFELC